MIIHDCLQGSDEWLALRAGIPTASDFSKLVTSTGTPSKSLNDYAITLAGEKYAGKPLQSFGGTVWTERGNELEPEADELYVFMRDVDTVPVGFITDDNQSYGCSPDRLVGDAGMIEIKCLKPENHIKVMMYYQKHGKAPSSYIAQTQGQLFVCEREWCDSVFYNPDLPPVIIRHTPDENLASSLKRQIEIVLAERDRILQLLKEF